MNKGPVLYSPQPEWNEPDGVEDEESAAPPVTNLPVPVGPAPIKSTHPLPRFIGDLNRGYWLYEAGSKVKLSIPSYQLKIEQNRFGWRKIGPASLELWPHYNGLPMEYRMRPAD